MASGRDSIGRRRYLLGTLGLAAASAGCSGLLGGENTDTEPDYTETPTSEPSYELDFSVVNDTVDLSDLDTQNLGSLDSIRDEDYVELEATVYEELGGNREEMEDYELDIQLGDQTVEPEQADNIYRIACTELETGENNVSVTADVDGQTLEQSATVTKQTPDAHLIEAIVDDEQITQYSSPYEFDTHRLDTEEFHQRRQEAVADQAHPDFIQSTTEQEEATELDSRPVASYPNNDPHWIRENFEELDSKVNILKYSGTASRRHVMENEGGAISVHAERISADQETVIKELHDDIETGDIFSSGFDNPAETDADAGNHGSIVHYFDGDWYHQETASTETRHVDEIETISMYGETGTHTEFVSVLGEFQEGEMDELQFDNKMLKMNAFYTSQIMPGAGINTEDITISDEYGSTGVDMIRSNTAREEMMTPIEAASGHFLETGENTAVLGTPDDPVLVSHPDFGRRGEIGRRVEEDPDFQDVDTVLDEALN